MLGLDWYLAARTRIPAQIESQADRSGLGCLGAPGRSPGRGFVAVHTTNPAQRRPSLVHVACGCANAYFLHTVIDYGHSSFLTAWLKIFWNKNSAPFRPEHCASVLCCAVLRMVVMRPMHRAQDDGPMCAFAQSQLLPTATIMVMLYRFGCE